VQGDVRWLAGVLIAPHGSLPDLRILFEKRRIRLRIVIVNYVVAPLVELRLDKESKPMGIASMGAVDQDFLESISGNLIERRISTTMRYAHSNDEAKRRAVQRLKSSDKTVTVVPRRAKIAV